MKLTKKIAISSASDVLLTVIGFAATIYLANKLGPGPLGTFALGLTFVNGLLLVDLGVGEAAIKRMSADTDERAAYFGVLVAWYAVLVGGSTLGIILFWDAIKTYVGGPFVGFVLVIYLSKRLYQLCTVALKADRKVYVRDTIDLIEGVFRRVFRVGLVALGFGVVGLFTGYAASFILAVVIAAVVVMTRTSVGIDRFDAGHVRSMLAYAKYAWANGIYSHSFSWIDITILGLFAAWDPAFGVASVTNGSIGVYQVAWSIAMAAKILGSAISRNLFPEISHYDSRGEYDRVRSLGHEALTYASLIPVPALVGAFLLGDRVLGVYGDEFTGFGTVLAMLMLVSLSSSLESMLRSFSTGINRPDIVFWSNLVFILTNVVFNVALIATFGILGAAIGTGLAVTVSAIVEWRLLKTEYDLRLPLSEFRTQVTGAALMAAVVIVSDRISPIGGLSELLGLISLGAVVYFSVVVIWSEQIRSKAYSLFPS